jgi:hypothetical protein
MATCITQGPAYSHHLSRGIYTKTILSSDYVLTDNDFGLFMDTLKDKIANHTTLTELDLFFTNYVFTTKQAKQIVSLIVPLVNPPEIWYLAEHICYARVCDPWYLKPRYGVEGYYYRDISPV